MWCKTDCFSVMRKLQIKIKTMIHQRKINTLKSYRVFWGIKDTEQTKFVWPCWHERQKESLHNNYSLHVSISAMISCSFCPLREITERHLTRKIPLIGSAVMPVECLRPKHQHSSGLLTGISGNLPTTLNWAGKSWLSDDESKKCFSLIDFLLFALHPQVGMFKIHPEIPESMSLEAKAFILRCFEPDPDRRATAFDLLTDEFLTVTSRRKKSKNSLTGRCSSTPPDISSTFKATGRETTVS